jgi:seryl-tRNA synthetase
MKSSHSKSIVNNHDYSFIHSSSSLLDDSIAHNTRIRQLLSRISTGVRDYDLLSKSLGLAYRHLPPELLDAFTYDPSIVSGATRRSQGWKAVEETHHRLIQQREAFRAFLSSSANTNRSPPGSLLHDPIASLLQTLNELEERKEEIATKIQSVAVALTNIQAVHAVVKKEYNATLSHTSVVYPEVRLQY